MLEKYLNGFWRWYERNLLLTVGISAGLFLLQILHLFWLSADVVAERLVGYSFFEPGSFWTLAIVLVDYLEIPTIISVSFIYVNEIRKKQNVKIWFYLILLNSQWIHIFWITDEVVEKILIGTGHTVLPYWAAWTAILIDYLELPIIADTSKRFLTAWRRRRLLKLPLKTDT